MDILFIVGAFLGYVCIFQTHLITNHLYHVLLRYINRFKKNEVKI